uniref:Myotubularin phosphatase domain-containing protein n=1 Tax=Globodera rostochiensis TaxID=31243 RepID=A0A914HBM8_GLORO
MLRVCTLCSIMPCNDSHSLNSSCDRMNGATVGVVDDHVFPSSSSDLALVDATRNVSIHSAPTPHCSQPVPAAEPQFNFNRNRSASTRSSLNVQSTFNALHPLPGEELDSDNCVNMESCRLFLTQYRIIVVAHSQSAMCAIPITGVELLEAKDIVGLQISSKDGRIIKLRAENSEAACAWYKKLVQNTCIVRELDDVFAFKFFSFCSKTKPVWLRQAKHGSAYDLLKKEFSRLKLPNAWKISTANKSFDICASYPQYLIVPASVCDEELKQMRLGRSYHRFPTLAWRCAKNGAVLLRSSQPSIGFFGMSNDKDVHLYERIRSAISNDANMKFLIVDARSYTAAWANRAKGGGFEGADAYPNAEVVFMGLPNIHNIRYSFHQLRLLMNSTLWLQNICQLFSAAERCLHSLLHEGISVLVHCSDGWDRTTQIVSLCMLIADPFYRTFEGFEMLVQRQWVEFGHKFSDRGGVLNGDDNEKSPVFLQFLDCVYQLWLKNPDQFQYNRRYLMKLVQHTFSGLFGTFIFNSLKEAAEHGGATVDTPDNGPKQQRCFQVWQYLGAHNTEFENPAYNKKKRSSMLRFPKLIQELEPWRDAYCCTAIQSRINNSDDSLSLHHNNGTGSTQDIASEKTNSTLSRSQSAASLHSLELNGPSSIHPAHGGGTYMNLSLSNGTSGATASAPLTSKLSGSCSNGSISSLEEKVQEFLDVDGLSKVPTQFEDYIIERDRKKELQTRKASPTAGTPTPIVRDGVVLFDGRPVVNGGETTTTTSRRTRNESVDSSSFEIVNGHHLLLNTGECRVKHCSHNSSSSLTSGICLPSSCSSTSTTLSNEFCSHNGFGCKNEILQESVENGDGDGLEIMLNGN